MIYLIVFLISTFLISLGLKTKRSFLRRILVFSGILLPCLLAGFRNISVGTDTSGYVLNLYNIAFKTNSFSIFVNIANNIYYSTDILYLLITYVISKFNFSFQLLLFIYECLIIIPIYLALKRTATKPKDITFGMLIFYFTFYNLSLNMIRQSIAISFVLLGFSYLNDKSKLKNKLLCIIFILIAIGFHDTAIISLLIITIYFYFNNIKIKAKQKTLIGMLLIALCIVALILYKPLLLFIGNSGIYSKALLYLNTFSNFDIDYLGTLLNLIIIFTLALNKKDYKNMNLNYKFGLLLSILNLLISFMGTFITYVHRIAYYLYYIIIVNYIAPLSSSGSKKNYINVRTLLIISVFFVYWFIVIFLNNSNETLPYIIYK